jgi:hypothetical protein
VAEAVANVERNQQVRPAWSARAILASPARRLGTIGAAVRARLWRPRPRRAGLRVTALGLAAFLILAPGIALLRQVAVLLMAGLVGAATVLVESSLLPLLPVDPVYGGAGLRVLGGIEPRGLAVGGAVGDLLHWLVPALFASPDLTVEGAAVSALVGPGVTVLARLLTALLATTVLVTAIHLAARRITRPTWRMAVTLAQLWLLLDLAHETDLGVRDLEATGLPFALAAFAPVDAQGQRVLLTTHLEALPESVIACLSAGLAVVACLLGMVALHGAVHLVMAAVRRRPLTLSPSAWRVPPWRVRPALGGLSRLAVMLGVVAVVSLSPMRTLAEGEMAVLVPPPVVADDVVESVQSGDAAPGVVAEAQADPAAPVSEPAPPPDAAPAAPSAAPTGSVVTLEGSNYQYTLRVDGRPTVVRGMGYNPWYASLPTEERQQRYRRDFSAMQEMGVNTLEGWFQDQFDEVTLDEAQRNGLKVIMPFELNQDYDYSDPAIKAKFRKEVTDWVLRYRDHPAVLMWGPGNEVMHRLIFPTAVQGKRDPAREKRADDFAAFYVELMDMIRSLDPNHPVVYRDAEDLYFARLRTALQRDGVARPWFIYGTNVYTKRLAEVIDRWPSQGVDAPLLVSEFSPGGSGAIERPGMFGWYWSTIRAHPKRVLGGVVYTWTTEGPEDLDRVFGLTDASGAPVDGSTVALSHLFRDEMVSRRKP